VPIISTGYWTIDEPKSRFEEGRMMRDEALWKTIKADFVEAKEIHGAEWTDKYINKMTDDLYKAIRAGKVLPPTVRLLKDWTTI
jgi:hypothetical protein